LPCLSAAVGLLTVDLDLATVNCRLLSVEGRLLQQLLPARIAIELSPVVCRVVETQGSVRRGGLARTRVKSFLVLAPRDTRMDRELASLRGRRVSAIVWNVPSAHLQVNVPDGSREQMRANAVEQIARMMPSADSRGLLADVTPLTPRSPDGWRRVAVAAADGAAIRSALAPLYQAGLHVRSVVTPPIALASLARTNPDVRLSGSSEAYVALEENVTSIAVVRDGALLSARDLPWGFLKDDSLEECRSHSDIVDRLGDELVDLFDTTTPDVTNVRVCGAAPELRTMTVRLIERLDMEVEALDSLLAIPVMPKLAADEFEERAAELRLVCSVAADWDGPLNLLRTRRRPTTQVQLARVAIAGGVAAAIAGAVELASSRQSSVGSQTHLSARQDEASARVAAQPPRTLQRGPSAPDNAPAQRLAAPSPSPPQRSERAPDAEVSQHAAAPLQSASTLQRGASVPYNKATQHPAARPGDIDSALPFDGALEMVLYGADRQVAIIDGRIVEIGDQFRGARVIAIEPAGVLLRDQAGRLRRMSLAPPAAR
jgi:hypothetical protein